LQSPGTKTSAMRNTIRTATPLWTKAGNGAVRLALTALCALGVVAATAAPAQALQWFQWSGHCGTFFTTNCWVDYTGSWPSGQVRAGGDHGLYEISLYTRVGDSGGYIVRSSTFSQNGGGVLTPTVAVGKYNWYKACIRTVQGGQLWCQAEGAIFLGD